MSKRKRDYLLFLEDIADAILRIEEYTNGMSFEKFRDNNMAIDAVIRNFEVIGEAANKIPDSIREKYPAIEWREAIGFRNILIHDYFGIDIEAVWDTIKKNLPPFKKSIVEVIQNEKSGENRKL